VLVEDLCEAGEQAVVYNLRVADYHTYFVGSREWRFSVWAHNRYSVQSKNYASSPLGRSLRQDALAVRGRLTDAAYRNIAVAQVRIGGRATRVKFVNTPGGMHSEEKLAAWYTAMRNNSKSVIVEAVYTDRRPCPTCGPLLANIFGGDLTVFYAQGPGTFIW
jgi:hypothetical protein